MPPKPVLCGESLCWLTMKGLNRIKIIGFGKLPPKITAKMVAWYRIFSTLFFFSQKFSDTCIMRVVEHFTKRTSLDALCQPFNTKVFIAPDNRLLLLRTDYQTSEQYSTILHQNGSYLCSWTSYFTCSKGYLEVDPQIVHLARQILQQRDQHKSIERKKIQFSHDVSNLESRIHKMMQVIDKHDKTAKNEFLKTGNTVCAKKIQF